MDQTKGQIIESIETRLADAFPDVELVDVDVQGGGQARVTAYIDRPGGVDLALCEAVARALDDLRADHALDVSSPGLDRPLRTPAHFRGAAGRHVYVKTATKLAGRAVFRGRLTAAGDDSLTLALDEGGDATIRYDTIAKAHVIFDFDDDGGHRE